MTLHIYNSLTNRDEAFQPLDPDHVTMYVCGPTVYDRIHIGNARPIVVFDVLYRLLQSQHSKVSYARNITDVDDKINNRAKETGQLIKDLTATTITYFHEDIDALNTLRPDVEPLATDHIPEMIAMITTLIDKGHAYEAEGHVLFAIESLSHYGELSGRNIEDMIAGARVEVAPYKRHPADFVLWKPSDADTPGWESPWGYGRPGWHIECSAMSTKYLGETFDIHGGGCDLIFPHHENELAQSTGVHGHGTFAKYWMHNGLLTVNGEKMSKSLGNFITLHEALQQHHGETVRCMLLSSHYRQSLDWTEQATKQAKANLDKLYVAVRDADDLPEHTPIDAQVLASLNKDLNVPGAMARLYEMATTINKETDASKKQTMQHSLMASAQVLGLLHEDREKWFTWIAPSSSADDILTSDEIESKIQQRLDARASKDFGKADEIRDFLVSKGIILEDSPQGTIWRRK
ncbi:MAG: cysteine--tRNA ligase [Alphaproteobacteria bacterium]